MDADEIRATEIVRSWKKLPKWTYGSIEGMGECCYDDDKPMGNFYIVDYDEKGRVIAIKWDNLSDKEKESHIKRIKFAIETGHDNEDADDW